MTTRTRSLDDLPGWLLPSLALVGLIAVWELVVVAFAVPLFVLPPPSKIFQATAAGLPLLPRHVGTTLYETLVGFALGIAIGVPLGILIVSSRLLRDTFYPLLLVTQSVPKVALAPVLLIAIGYGELPKIIVVFLVCFFPIVVATAAGLESAPPEILDLARANCATQLDTFRKIRFPAAMPQIFVGLKVAITLAVIGAVIGEFVGADRGLGYLILISTSTGNPPLGFGAILILAILSILLFYGVEALERVMVFWTHE
jgi:NitT/TauT family transport system permease protein